MATQIGAVVIHSTDPRRLSGWYAKAFGGKTGEIGDGGFGLQLGDQNLLFFTHDEVAGPPSEPARIIVNFAVDDAEAVGAKLNRMDARWVRPLERGGPGWIGTVVDADGNYVQILQLVDGAHDPS